MNTMLFPEDVANVVQSFQWNLAQSDLDERGRIHDFYDEQRRNAGVQQTVQPVL